MSAFQMPSIMEGVVQTGTAQRLKVLKRPIAGKTGTTNDYNDAWFVGFTPKLVAGVWVGFDQPRTIMPRGFASDVAVPMWTAFMKVATRGDKPLWFDTPEDITSVAVCRLSGKLPTEGCEHADVVDDDGKVQRRSMVYTEYFVRGTQPTQPCDLHPTRGFFGQVASIFTGGDKPAPPRAADVVPPPAAAAQQPPTVANNEPPKTEAEAPKKKRGFWSRVFGRGRDRDQKR
jgi:penicillin-binding protein 1A